MKPGKNTGFKNIIFPSLPSSENGNFIHNIVNLTFISFVSEDCLIKLEYWFELEMDLYFGDSVKIVLPICVGKLAGWEDRNILPPHTDEELYFEM